MTREETVRYQHRQVGRVTLGAMIVGILVAWIALGAAASQDQWPAALALGLVMALVPLQFGWLTVTVTSQAIHLRFGIGWIRRRIPIANVRSVTTVRNRWYYGWGIRLTPHGWLWNVAGLDAVELHLTSGRRFRIGTDEPTALEGALRRELLRRQGVGNEAGPP
jgi:hypothetical protein